MAQRLKFFTNAPRPRKPSEQRYVTLSRRYNLNPKTVRKCRSRDTVEEVPMGPSNLDDTSAGSSSEGYIFVVTDRTTKIVHAELIITSL